jgi:hypothetical protein
MKSLFLTVTLLALPLLAVPSQAHAWGCGACCGSCSSCGPDAGLHVRFNLGLPDCLCGPGFAYYPYLAHFQAAPAKPVPYPAFGPPGAVPVGYGPPPRLPVAQPPAGYGPPPGMPVAQPPAMPPVAVQPTGFAPGAPTYWYGR